MYELNSSKKPVYIGKTITVGFNKAAVFIKKPVYPDIFSWNGETFYVAELISQWHDFKRKGKYSHNMKDAHLERANMKESLGVGRFFLG